MYLCREMTDASLPQIGEAFGGRDHTTVIHACSKIVEKVEKRLFIPGYVDQIAGAVKAGSEVKCG